MKRSEQMVYLLYNPTKSDAQEANRIFSNIKKVVEFLEYEEIKKLPLHTVYRKLKLMNQYIVCKERKIIIVPMIIN